MDWKSFIPASLLVLAACSGGTDTPTPIAPATPATVRIETTDGMRGVSGVIHFDPAAYRPGQFEAKQPDLLISTHLIAPGELKFAILASDAVHGTLAEAHFDAIGRASREPQVMDYYGVSRDTRRVSLQQGVSSTGLRSTSIPVTGALSASFAAYTLGDFDQSGDTSVTDVVNLLNIETLVNTSPTTYQIYISDLNGDGTVDLVDAVKLLDKAINPNQTTEVVYSSNVSSLSVGTGQSLLVLIGNSGNGSLPSITTSAPSGVTVSDVTPSGGLSRAYQISASVSGLSGNVTFTPSGYSALTSSLTVNDITAPQVSLSASSTSVTVPGSVTLTANATDNRAVTQVEFYAASLLGTDTTSPFTQAVTYSPRLNGSYSYTGKAFDAAGNTTTSSALGVTVDIPGLIPGTTTCSGIGVGQTCTMQINKVGTTASFKGMSLQISLPGFTLSSVSLGSLTSGCFKSNALASSGVYNVGVTCLSAVSGTGNIAVLNYTRSTTGAVSATTSNTTLSSADIVSVTIPVYGDSLSIN